jgi:GTP-binding protein HflX
MAEMISGDLRGLQPSQLRQLEQLYGLHLGDRTLITPEFAYHLATLSHAIRHPLSCYLDAAGQVVHVAVGSPNQTIFPPEVNPSLPQAWRCIATLLQTPNAAVFQAIAQHHLTELILVQLHSDDRGNRALETEVPIQQIERVIPTPQTEPAWTVEPISLDVLLKPTS